MSLSYDVFTASFLGKVRAYDFIPMSDYDRTQIIDGYMKRACAQFAKICKYDLTVFDDNIREFEAEIPEGEIDEISDIVSEGMLVQWFKQYFYQQENYANYLNTTDYNGYSPAELLYRITSAYKASKRDFIVMMREYSFNHGDLGSLHT